MTDTWTAGAEPPPAAPESRPVLLRAAREAAGLHIAALAAALKVPVKKLEALEAGRYGELPDMTFARALASSACRQLKIDPAPVLAQIPHGRQAALGDTVQAINAPFKPSQDVAPGSPVGWLSRPAVLGAIALLLAALVLVFLPQMDTAPEPVMPPPAGAEEAADAPVPAQAPGAVTTDMAAEPATTEPGQATATVDSGAATATASATGTLPAQVSASAVPSTPATASVTATGAAAGGALLQLTATGDAWIEVVNGSGSTVVQRMMRAGDVLEFSTAPPYAVVLGRADAVQVSVRGRPFDTTPYARNSVARFEVK